MGRQATTSQDMTYNQVSKLTNSLPGWLHIKAKDVAKKKGLSFHRFIEIEIQRAVETYEKRGY